MQSSTSSAALLHPLCYVPRQLRALPGRWLVSVIAALQGSREHIAAARTTCCHVVAACLTIGKTHVSGVIRPRQHLSKFIAYCSNISPGPGISIRQLTSVSSDSLWSRCTESSSD